MVCKKCGEEINKAYDFCPKCGNKIVKKKSSSGKIIVIIVLLIILLAGAGVFLYVSGYYQNILAQFGYGTEETVSTLTNSDVNTQSTDIDQVDTVKPQENAENTETKKEKAEINEEQPDEISQYLMGLSIEPVEMVMGETYLVELEKRIPDAVWNSSDEEIVQVAEGQLKAVMPGNATVTLSAEEKDVTFDVTVNAFPDLTLAVNCSTTVEINDAISDVQWESSVPEMVSVSDGVLTSLASGASTVTAYIGEVPYSFEVVATTPDITTTSVRKIIGNTQQVSILGTNGKVEWKSDNTAIATVSDTGLITAEGTGAGQSTVVHAYVDGMEFKIDVAVEPIPQLSSTYKMYGHQDDSTYKNARITICTNANETVTYVRGNKYYDDFWDVSVENVLNVADADYSDGLTFPIYHAFSAYKDNDNYTDVYLVGTSQTADVLIQGVSRGPKHEFNDIISKSDSIVTYEPCENYGIIHIYNHGGNNQLVTISVDGYQYQFVINYPENNYQGRFSYAKVDDFPTDYMIEECSVDEVVVHEKVNVNYSTLESNSRTYNTGNDWMERIGTKFVEAVEDEAISMAAGFLLKAIFV